MDKESSAKPKRQASDEAPKTEILNEDVEELSDEDLGAASGGIEANSSRYTRKQSVLK